jgi:FMN phosphatase YigB (HAD superfamily)
MRRWGPVGNVACARTPKIQNVFTIASYLNYITTMGHKRTSKDPRYWEYVCDLL